MLDEWGVGLGGRLSQQLLPRLVADFAAPQASEYCWVGISAPMTAGQDISVFLDGDQLWLDLGDAPLKEPLYATIVDVSGKDCTRAVPIHAHSGRQTLSVSDISSGLYLLQLKGLGAATVSRRFIKTQ